LFNVLAAVWSVGQSLALAGFRSSLLTLLPFLAVLAVLLLATILSAIAISAAQPERLPTVHFGGLGDVFAALMGDIMLVAIPVLGLIFVPFVLYKAAGSEVGGGKTEGRFVSSSVPRFPTGPLGRWPALLYFAAFVTAQVFWARLALTYGRLLGVVPF